MRKGKRFVYCVPVINYPLQLVCTKYGTQLFARKPASRHGRTRNRRIPSPNHSTISAPKSG